MTDEIKNKITSIKNHFIPDGYKKTKIGVIPIEWDFQKLSKFLYVNKEKNIKLEYTKKDVFSISGEKGIVNQIDFLGRSYAGESVAPYRIVYPDNIVYTKSPLKNNPYGIIKANKTKKTGIVSTLYAVYCCNNTVLPEYIEYYFGLDLIINNYLYPLVNIGSKHDMKISDENVLKGYVVIPAIYEQKRIIEILSTQDKVIELKEKMIAEKQRQKKYLMQQLLTGKRRLKGFNEKWKRYCFREIGEIISGGTPDTKKPEYWNGNIYWCTPTDITFSGKYISKTEKTITELGLKNSTAILLPINSILMCSRATIGPRSINTIPMATNQGFKSIIVNEEIANVHYIFDLIEICLYDLVKLSNGSTFLELSMNAFNKYMVKIPNIKEQTAIAEILSTADKEIDLLQKELEQEKQKKKSLMQLLLTGIVRV